MNPLASPNGREPFDWGQGEASGALQGWNDRTLPRDQHNVVVQKGPASFQSALKTSGSFKRKLKKKGTYTIICSIHAPGMKMKLKVK